LECLDAAGEYLVDDVTGILSFIPPASVNPGDTLQAVVSLNNDSIINVEDVSFVSFVGISVKHGRGRGLRVSSSFSVSLVNLTVACVGEVGIDAWQVGNVTIAGAQVSGAGWTGVSVAGGDRATLTPSNITVRDSTISNFGR
jgi:hypothetical protein